MEERKKPLFIVLLNILVACLLIYQSIIVIIRINKIALEYILININDLFSLFFLLIFLNKSIRTGVLLFFFSFVCSFVLQFIFSTNINTGKIVSICLRFIAFIFLSYSWLRTIVKRKYNIKDKNTAQEYGKPFYLASPDGTLQVYDPITDSTRVVNTNMPSDPNDPNSKNNVDPGKNNYNINFQGSKQK